MYHVWHLSVQKVIKTQNSTELCTCVPSPNVGKQTILQYCGIHVPTPLLHGHYF